MKNKIAPPFKGAEFDIINKRGSWYSYDGAKLGQGRESTKTYLSEHSDFLVEVEKKVREHYQLQVDNNGVTKVQIAEEKFDDIPEDLLEELEQEETTTVESTI